MSKPDCPQDFPYSVELDAGSHYWCSCGKSSAQPLCDGSHSGTDFQPVKFDVTEKKPYSLCGCKKTKNPPYCDGSHNK
ncbi:MAG: CDGSH iron-sulfur domain-containing protein [Woeseiaceae bacterium]